MKMNRRIGTAKLLAVALAGALLVAAVTSTATAEEWVCRGLGSGNELKLGTGEPISGELKEEMEELDYHDTSYGWVEMGGIRLEAIYGRKGVYRWWIYDSDGDGTTKDDNFVMLGEELQGDIIKGSWRCEERQ